MKNRYCDHILIDKKAAQIIVDYVNKRNFM